MRHGHVAYFDAAGALVAEPRLVPLTETGRDQADAAGRVLAAVPFDRIICSGLPRTEETARRVRAHQTAPPPLEIDTDLEEIRGGGQRGAIRFDPARAAAAMTFLFDAAGEPGARMGEGGEVFADALIRVVGALERLLAAPGWSRALIVAHEGVNRLILGWMTGAGLAAVSAFEQDFACINILDFDLVPAEAPGTGAVVQRRMIKALNMTADNMVKAGMYLTSFESLVRRPA